MFDIYSYYGYLSDHDFSYLGDFIPEFDIEKVAPLLLTNYEGFLGFNLQLNIARDVFKFLNGLEPKRTHGRIISNRYRDLKPKFTPETAYPIAESEMKKRQMKYPQITFGETMYTSTYNRLEYFAFFSGGKEWLDGGLIPGGLFVNVDKLDGHIWATNEGDELDL